MREKSFAFAPGVFTMDAAAHYLGVSKRTVEKYVRAGLLHTYRLPDTDNPGESIRKTLILKRDLDRFIASGVEV